jgi:hypothetical protein
MRISNTSDRIAKCAVEIRASQGSGVLWVLGLLLASNSCAHPAPTLGV